MMHREPLPGIPIPRIPVLPGPVSRAPAVGLEAVFSVHSIDLDNKMFNLQTIKYCISLKVDLY